LHFLGVSGQLGRLALETPQLALEPQRVSVALGEDALGASARRAPLDGFEERVDSGEE